MNESKQRLTESVSALVDGEVSELELHRILKELESEEALDSSQSNDQTISQKWSRYNLISQAMASTPLYGKDISQSVSEAIARESTHKASVLKGIFQAKSLGQFAIAASVATMAIVGVQQLNNNSPLQDQGFQAADSSREASEQLQRPANQFPSGFQPMIEARTVNAGGSYKTSQQPSLIKLFIPSNDSQKSELDLKAKDLVDKDSVENELKVKKDAPAK
ncbi:MAG: sigma-E factor negative regulatory protein [Porticoccaceae bacterium]